MKNTHNSICTEKYNFCNHHHEINDEQTLMELNGNKIVADNKRIALLKALNACGLITRTHCYGGKTGYSFVSILMNNNLDISIKNVSEGLALINVMKSVKSPIITIVNEEVCSMGSHISIAGDQRLIYGNGVIMFHDMTTGIHESSLKIKDRAKFIEKYYKLLEDNMRENTKLTNKEIIKARTGELWLFADDCLDKGVVDKIIGIEEENKK